MIKGFWLWLRWLTLCEASKNENGGKKLTTIHWAYGVICDLVLIVGLALHISQGIQISI